MNLNLKIPLPEDVQALFLDMKVNNPMDIEELAFKSYVLMRSTYGVSDEDALKEWNSFNLGRRQMLIKTMEAAIQILADDAGPKGDDAEHLLARD